MKKMTDMSQPLVSIAIPAYNSEKYLAPALQSCLDQTYPNIEVVISDDQSKDGTVMIIREFMQKAGNIRYVTQEKNLGPVANVNAAVGMAKGEFVIILDHDDMLPPHHVERMVKHFTSPDIALVHCNAMRIDSAGREIRMVGCDQEKIKQSRRPLKYLCFNNFIQSCGMMFRRSAFEAIGGWDESFYYDGEWDSYVRYAEKFKFDYATDTFGYYRVHETNITHLLQTKEKIFALDANRQRCRDRAFRGANLNVFETALMRFKIFRKDLRRTMKHGLAPPPEQKAADSYKRVLIIKLSAFGDFINTFGVFAAVRKHHPHAEITLLTTKPFIAFAEKSPYFDKVWCIGRWKWNEFSAWSEFHRAMKEKNFDVVYDIQRNDRARAFYWLSPARTRAAWVSGAKGNQVYVKKKPLPQGVLDTTDTDVFPVPDTPWLDADISHFNISAPFVLLVPGSAPQHPGKRWPVSHYVQLAQELLKRGYTPVALGTAAEETLLQDLAGRVPGLVNLCNKTSLLEIGALSRRAACAIGNDTGPMHLTAAVGCPTIVLFSGLSDPVQSRPRGEIVETLQGIPIETLSVESVRECFEKHVRRDYPSQASAGSKN